MVHVWSQSGDRQSQRFTDRLREIDMFFQGRDPVHQTLRRTARRLERAGIPYAVVGGMALNAHGYHRTTNDVDLLLNEEGFAEFCRRFVGKSYDRAPRRRRRFVDRANAVTVNILPAGAFPGTGEPGPIAYPEPTNVAETIETYRVVDVATLIQLKLAARRHRDFGDVVELIRILQLDESFAKRLHPSVGADYIECLEEKRREEAYEARHG